MTNQENTERWGPVLGPLLRDGATGRDVDGIPDFVAEELLTDVHAAEMSAQETAVETAYEDEDKLACHWDRISSREVAPLLGLREGTILDLGCATGAASLDLVERGFTVVGADLTLACLKVAATRYQAVVRANAVELPFKDEAFDGLVSRGALHHFQEPERSLTEVARVLKPGAPVVFSDPREYDWLEWVKHTVRRNDDAFTHDHHAYEPEEYRALIARDFDIISVQTKDPVGLLLANAVDLLPLPSATPFERLTRGFYRLDRFLNRTPLARFGHLITVTARKRA